MGVAGVFCPLIEFSFPAPAVLCGSQAGRLWKAISRRCLRRNLTFLPGPWQVFIKYSIHEFGDDPQNRTDSKCGRNTKWLWRIFPGLLTSTSIRLLASEPLPLTPQEPCSCERALTSRTRWPTKSPSRRPRPLNDCLGRGPRAKPGQRTTTQTREPSHCAS